LLTGAGTLAGSAPSRLTKRTLRPTLRQETNGWQRLEENLFDVFISFLVFAFKVSVMAFHRWPGEKVFVGELVL
jgi:hypothetical protein